jgi:hypothetical protein
MNPKLAKAIAARTCASFGFGTLGFAARRNVALQNGQGEPMVMASCGEAAEQGAEAR